MDYRRFKIINEQQKEVFENLMADKNLSREDLLLILTTVVYVHSSVDRESEKLTDRDKRVWAIADDLFEVIKCYDLTVFEAKEVIEALQDRILSKTKINN